MRALLEAQGSPHRPTASRDLQKAKRAMLRAAVDQNLAEIEGRKPRGLTRSPWPRRLAAAAAVLAVAGVGLGFAAVRRDLARPVEVAVVGTPGTASAAPAPATATPLPEPVVPAETGHGAAPPRIDPSVFPVAVRRIVIDPGHGGVNPGTSAPGGLLEKDLTLDIATRLRALLVAAGYEVVMTRQTDRDVSLHDRAAAANDGRADLFVSIHLNWIYTRERGIETYYLGPADDPYLNDVARRENQNSGYAVADLRRLLDAVYADARGAASRQLATAVQKELFRTLRRTNPALEDRGVKTAPFVVLVATGVPAILAEVSCLSSDEEAALLATDPYRQDIAQALFAGIRDYASASAPASTLAEKGTPPT